MEITANLERNAICTCERESRTVVDIGHENQSVTMRAIKISKSSEIQNQLLDFTNLFCKHKYKL